MFIFIVSLFLLTSPLAQSSALAGRCQEQGIDTAVCAVFQTLEAAWQAEKNYKQDNGGKYLLLSVLNQEHLTVSAFEKELKCQLPVSPITDSAYLVTVGQAVDLEDSYADTTLVIGFFNGRTTCHLPFANFRCNLVTGDRQYEYVTPDTTFKLAY